MLAPILASVLVASATFDSAQTIEQKTAFFHSQAHAHHARVKALKPSVKSALEPACRNALTLPERHNIKEALEQKLGFSLPESVSFIDAEITEYKQEKQQEWLTCTGIVTITEGGINEAGLAIRSAWQISNEKDKTKLRPLLKIALSHSSTVSDAVALVAIQSPQNERLAYLDSYLVASELRLDEAKASVAQIWFKSKRFEQVIALMQQCESIDCKRLNLAAKAEYEQDTADDLSSYF